MRFDIIADAIRREAAYWMALVVCPTPKHWEQTYRYYYNSQDRVMSGYIINFGKEIEGVR